MLSIKSMLKKLKKDNKEQGGGVDYKSFPSEKRKEEKKK